MARGEGRALRPNANRQECLFYLSPGTDENVFTTRFIPPFPRLAGRAGFGKCGVSNDWKTW